MMLMSVREGYRLWAPTYDSSANPLMSLEARHLAAWLENVRGKRVIDVACGTGRWIEWTGGMGIDLSPEMLSVARSKAKGRMAQGDALRLPFASGIADVVLCTLSLGYLSPVRRAMEEMRRVARPGGAVIVTDLHPEALRRGWTQSFRSGGTAYDIENHPYGLDDLAIDGLALEEARDLFFGEPEAAIYERAGKAALFNEVWGTPAVWMLRWRAA
jgi:ubiquinone/menaquinone biosynthesis C-methylase UbiE